MKANKQTKTEGDLVPWRPSTHNFPPKKAVFELLRYENSAEVSDKDMQGEYSGRRAGLSVFFWSRLPLLHRTCQGRSAAMQPALD